MLVDPCGDIPKAHPKRTQGDLWISIATLDWARCSGSNRNKQLKIIKVPYRCVSICSHMRLKSTKIWPQQSQHLLSLSILFLNHAIPNWNQAVRTAGPATDDLFEWIAWTSTVASWNVSYSRWVKGYVPDKPIPQQKWAKFVWVDWTPNLTHTDRCGTKFAVRGPPETDFEGGADPESQRPSRVAGFPLVSLLRYLHWQDCASGPLPSYTPWLSQNQKGVSENRVYGILPKWPINKENMGEWWLNMGFWGTLFSEKPNLGLEDTWSTASRGSDWHLMNLNEFDGSSICPAFCPPCDILRHLGVWCELPLGATIHHATDA